MYTKLTTKLLKYFRIELRTIALLNNIQYFSRCTLYIFWVGGKTKNKVLVEKRIDSVL